MKKITLLFLLLSSFTILFAQAPQKMSYQSVIRKADGKLVANTLVSIKTSIIFDTATGNPSYIETQTTTTNNNGLATIEIGGGTPVAGTFAAINWGAGSHFLKTEIDPTGGSNYTISGTSQLLSVPYALYSGSSQNQGKPSIIITGDITDAQAAQQIEAEYGPNTEKIYVINTTNLTTLTLNSIRKVIDFKVNDNLNLVSLSFNNLYDVYNDLEVSGNPKLSSILFPALKTIRGNHVQISNNSSLTSVSLPVLTKVQYFTCNNNSLLSSIEIPLLSSSYSSRTTLSFSNNALPSSNVNLILNIMLKVFSSRENYVGLADQNPPAPPTGQGLIDKATLINAGNSVVTD